MALTYVFGGATLSLLAAEFGMVDASSSLRCALFTSAWTPNGDLRYLSEMSGEVTDASYARQPLTGVVVTYDPAMDATVLNADDVTFPNLTAVVRYVVFFRDGGTPEASPLLVYWDLQAPETSTAAPYVVTIDPAGLLRIVAGT